MVQRTHVPPACTDDRSQPASLAFESVRVLGDVYQGLKWETYLGQGWQAQEMTPILQMTLANVRPVLLWTF